MKSVAIISTVTFLLIFGEVVPKSAFQQKADTIATRLIYGLRFFSYLFYPVIFVFSRIARFITRIVGGGAEPASWGEHCRGSHRDHRWGGLVVGSPQGPGA